MAIEQILENVPWNLIYDAVKGIIFKSKEEAQKVVANVLNVDGANVFAEKIVTILAKDGAINVQSTNLYSRESINLGSSVNGSLVIGNKSISETAKTCIYYGKDCYIKMQGNASIRQGSDGSISFYA